jgi:hypothetical protein
MNLYPFKEAKSHGKHHYPMVFVPAGVHNVNTKRGEKIYKRPSKKRVTCRCNGLSIIKKRMLWVAKELTNVLNFLKATNNNLNLSHIIIAGFSAVADIAKLRTYLKIILNFPIN